MGKIRLSGMCFTTASTNSTKDIDRVHNNLKNIQVITTLYKNDN